MNKLRLGLSAAVSWPSRMINVIALTSPSFMCASASRMVLKWSLLEKPSADDTFFFLYTFSK